MAFASVVELFHIHPMVESVLNIGPMNTISVINLYRNLISMQAWGPQARHCISLEQPPLETTARSSGKTRHTFIG